MRLVKSYFFPFFPIQVRLLNTPGSTITNGREPRSCLDQVFNCKLGSFTDNTKNVAACKWPLLKLKTRPRFCPVSWSLSMVWPILEHFRSIVGIHSHETFSTFIGQFYNLTLSTRSSPPALLITPLGHSTQAFRLSVLITFVDTFYFNYHCK